MHENEYFGSVHVEKKKNIQKKCFLIYRILLNNGVEEQN